MMQTKITGMRAIVVAVIGLMTAAAPGIIGLHTTLTDKGEEKADLGYELMRQRLEFLTERMDQVCADVRELRIILLGVHERAEFVSLEEVSPPEEEDCAEAVADIFSAGDMMDGMDAVSGAGGVTVDIVKPKIETESTRQRIQKQAKKQAPLPLTLEQAIQEKAK